MLAVIPSGINFAKKGEGSAWSYELWPFEAAT